MAMLEIYLNNPTNNNTYSCDIVPHQIIGKCLRLSIPIDPIDRFEDINNCGEIILSMSKAEAIELSADIHGMLAQLAE